jgi:hypothetical protein
MLTGAGVPDRLRASSEHVPATSRRGECDIQCVHHIIHAATLRTINALNTALQIDNQRWPPEQAPRRAAGYLRRMVQFDYYDTTHTTDNDKVAAFARRWAGLVLTRREDYVLKFD